MLSNLSAMIWFFPLLLALLVNSFIEVIAKEEPSISDPSTHFGCKFEPDNGPYGPYQFKLPKNSHPSDYWGQTLHHKEFKTQTEFKQFYDKLEKIRKDLIGRYTVDTISPFVQFWNKFNSFAGSETPESIYDAFVYTAKRNNSRTYDEIDMVLRVYEELSIEYPDLKDHFVMGVSDLGVTPIVLNFTETLEATTLGVVAPPKYFQFEHITGVIKVSVKGKFGYVLVDPASYEGPCPILMRDSEFGVSTSKKTPRESRHDTMFQHELKYSWMNGDNGYIRIVNKKIDYTYMSVNFKRIDVLFIGTSLCPFLETVGKSSLLNSYRYMRKTDSKGDALFSCEVFFYYPVFLLWLMENSIDVFILRGIRKENGRDSAFEYTDRLPRSVDWEIDSIREVSKGLISNQTWLEEHLKVFEQLSERKNRAGIFLKFISKFNHLKIHLPFLDEIKGIASRIQGDKYLNNPLEMQENFLNLKSYKIGTSPSSVGAILWIM